jgi:hypothetical protein
MASRVITEATVAHAARLERSVAKVGMGAPGCAGSSRGYAAASYDTVTFFAIP